MASCYYALPCTAGLIMTSTIPAITLCTSMKEGGGAQVGAQGRFGEQYPSWGRLDWASLLCPIARAFVAALLWLPGLYADWLLQMTLSCLWSESSTPQRQLSSLHANSSNSSSSSSSNRSCCKHNHLIRHRHSSRHSCISYPCTCSSSS